jgi:hypothetical protein
MKTTLLPAEARGPRNRVQIANIRADKILLEGRDPPHSPGSADIDPSSAATIMFGALNCFGSPLLCE